MLLEHAGAKINLALAVTGQRPDGFHLLDTIAVFAEIGDTLSVEDADGLSLHIDGPFAETLAAAPDNLVLRAARLLVKTVGRNGCRTPGAKLRLTKRLPVASGIGGGSADAAAALRALNRLWRLDLRPAQLAEAGSRLGADVAMCVYGRALRAQGIGERITLLDDVPDLPLVLANPGVTLETAAVFASFPGEFSGNLPEPPRHVDAAELASWLAGTGNDLQASAARLAPQIVQVIGALEGCAGSLLARMSGSGATCFAIFRDQDAAQRAARVVSAAHPDWWVVATTAR